MLKYFFIYSLFMYIKFLHYVCQTVALDFFEAGDETLFTMVKLLCTWLTMVNCQYCKVNTENWCDKCEYSIKCKTISWFITVINTSSYDDTITKYFCLGKELLKPRFQFNTIKSTILKMNLRCNDVIKCCVVADLSLPVA